MMWFVVAAVFALSLTAVHDQFHAEDEAATMRALRREYQR